MKDVKPGTYSARVVDYGIPEMKEGKQYPQVYLQFELDIDGEKHLLGYYGSLHPKASDYTIKGLIGAGFKYDNLEKLLEPNAFDGRECSVVVERHEYNGKVSSRIKWINKPSKFKAMDPSLARGFLTSFTSDVKFQRSQATGGQSSDFSPPAYLSEGPPIEDYEI